MIEILSNDRLVDDCFLRVHSARADEKLIDLIRKFTHAVREDETSFPPQQRS